MNKSEDFMNHLENITRQIPTYFDERNTDWMVFLRDHLNNLRKSSTIHYLDQYQKRIIKFRPEIILELNNIPLKYTYIFLLLNYLSSPFEVTNLDSVYIPDVSKITEIESNFQLNEKSKELRKATKVK
jgi:hypothetical protein